MTPARESAIQILRQMRDAAGLEQLSPESEELTTLNSLIYTMHGRRHLIGDALAHRAERAIADMRLEQG